VFVGSVLVAVPASGIFLGVGVVAWALVLVWVWVVMSCDDWSFVMKRLFGLSCLCVFVVFVVGGVLSGSAFALPTILPLKANAKAWEAGEKVTFTLETLGGSKISCEEFRAEGSLLATGELGSVHITFGGNCKFGSEACTSLGGTAGQILELGTWHYVLLPGGGLGILLLFNTPASEIHYSCKVAGINALILDSGDLVCPITPTGVKIKTTETATLKCKQTKGDPEPAAYLNDEEKETKTELKMKSPLGTELLGEESSTRIKFAEETELMT